jgi:ABC-type lipoprotein export system ATPase subunit
MIRLINVSKTYHRSRIRVAALADVSLEVAPGTFAALMGPSGCGKSTLLHLVAGVDLPTAGEVWVNGQELSRLSDAALSRFRRDQVGIVYQFYNLLPTLSAGENVALPALLTGVRTRVAHERADDWLKQVGMLHRREHWPHELSGGELQRVAIARALVNGPSILLADEPTGNLDSKAGLEVLDLLARLNLERRVKILLATHSQEAAAYAHRVIRLRDGTVLLDEPSPSTPHDLEQSNRRTVQPLNPVFS